MRRILLLCCLVTSILVAMEEEDCQAIYSKPTKGVSVVTNEKPTYNADKSREIISKKPLNSIVVDYSQLKMIDGVVADELRSNPLLYDESINLDKIMSFSIESDGSCNDFQVGNTIKKYLITKIQEYALLTMIPDIVDETTVTYNRTKEEITIKVDSISEEERSMVRLLLDIVPRREQIKWHLAARRLYVSGSCKALSNDIREYVRVMKLDESHNPLCHVTECIEPSCVLSRDHFPKIRAFLEDTIVRCVQKPHVYLDHCCGNLYQTMVILETLRKHNKFPQTVILVDQDYKPFVAEVRKEGGYILDVDKKLGDFKSVKKVRFEDRPRIYGMYYALCQFARWYKGMCNIIIYSTAKEYLENCKNKNIEKADLITSVDYFEPESKEDIDDHSACHGFLLLQNDGLTADGVTAQLIKQKPKNDKELEPVELRIQTGQKRIVHAFDYSTSEWHEANVCST